MDAKKIPKSEFSDTADTGNTSVPSGADTPTATKVPADTVSPRQHAPPSQSQFTFVYLFLFMMAILIMFDTSSRNGFVMLINTFMYPLVGFSGHLPILSIFILAVFFMIFTTSVRNYHTDWVTMAKSQKWGSHLSKLQMKYMREGKKDKMKELEVHQRKVAELNMKVMGSTLKYMSITLFFIILFFAWLSYLLSMPTSFSHFAVPWNFNSNLQTSYLFPTYIIVYSLFTIPFSMFFYRIFKHLSLKKRYEKMTKE